MLPLLITPLMLFGATASVPVQAQAPSEVHATIVSTEHPVDSQGETVYAFQGKDDMSAPVIPGLLVNPSVLKQPEPKFSRALRREKFNGEVAVIFVVTAIGKPIDFETKPGDDKEAVACALEAVRKYKFAPAMLDGKAVATRIKVVVAFILT